jgi:hypothetical protein
MQRWTYILAVVLGVQLLLAGGLALRGDRLAPARSDAPLITADLQSVDRLTIDGPVAANAESAKSTTAARVELVKRDGGWVMPANFDAPADAKKVEAVLKQLAGARRGLPIATSAQALDRFKVGEHDYERRIVASQGEKALATVYLSSAPGGRKANARTAQDSAVYSVDVAPYDLPAGAAEWLDKALLQRDAATLARIEVADAGKPAITLRRVPAPAGNKDAQASDDGANEKNEGDKKDTDKKDHTNHAPASMWSAEGLGAGQQLDQAKAVALAEAIANLRVDSVLGTEAQPDWQQEVPRLRLTVADAQDKAVTWTIVKPKSGDAHILKASDWPWYFELKSWDAQPLLDAAATDKLVAQPGAPAPAKSR